MVQLYLKDVQKRLGVSTTTINKLTEDGSLPCNPGKCKRRTWSEETISRFRQTQLFKKISDAKCVVFIQAYNNKQAQLHQRKALMWCKAQGYKTEVICQIVKNGQNNTKSFRKAVEEMRSTKSQALLYFGNTPDVESLANCYKALEYLQVLDISKLELKQATKQEGFFAANFA